jgi:hypothetical protein
VFLLNVYAGSFCIVSCHLFKEPWKIKTTTQLCRRIYTDTLCLGPSGLLLAYQMGVFAVLIEGEEIRTLLKSVKLTGISGGVAVAGYIYADI